MPQLDVVNFKNEKVGTVELPDGLFAVEINKPLIHEAVVMQQAAMRQGTASTKTRGFVRGGGKKPWKQKGTGRARHGSIRSPIWRGGAIVFGPHPRSYAYAFPKKKARAALHGALSAKVKAGEVVIIDGLELAEAKTRVLAAGLKALGLSRRVLVVMERPVESFERAAQNLPNVDLIRIAGLNVFDLLAHRHIIIPRAALEPMQEVWA